MIDITKNGISVFQYIFQCLFYCKVGQPIELKEKMRGNCNVELLKLWGQTQLKREGGRPHAVYINSLWRNSVAMTSFCVQEGKKALKSRSSLQHAPLPDNSLFGDKDVRSEQGCCCRWWEPETPESCCARPLRLWKSGTSCSERWWIRSSTGSKLCHRLLGPAMSLWSIDCAELFYWFVIEEGTYF